MDFKVNNFYYQLQNYNANFFANINKSKDDIWVLDQYKDIKNKFSLYEILSFKKNNNRIYSYLSVGEAESYRSYFESIPKDLLEFENKNWKGNFIVKFWDHRWHDILYGKDSYLDSIQSNGFDGVFLDVIDVYQRFDDQKEYATKMAELVIGISKAAKNKNANFKINIQNGLEIIDELPPRLRKEFIDSIDGLSVEAHYFNYAKTISKNPWFNQYHKLIVEYQKFNKDIFMIEYTQDPSQVRDVRQYCLENNIKLLITDKPLKGDFFLHN